MNRLSLRPFFVPPQATIDGRGDFSFWPWAWVALGIKAVLGNAWVLGGSFAPMFPGRVIIAPCWLCQIAKGQQQNSRNRKPGF